MFYQQIFGLAAVVTAVAAAATCPAMCLKAGQSNVQLLDFEEIDIPVSAGTLPNGKRLGTYKNLDFDSIFAVMGGPALQLLQPQGGKFAVSAEPNGEAVTITVDPIGTLTTIQPLAMFLGAFTPSPAGGEGAVPASATFTIKGFRTSNMQTAAVEDTYVFTPQYQVMGQSLAPVALQEYIFGCDWTGIAKLTLSVTGATGSPAPAMAFDSLRIMRTP